MAHLFSQSRIVARERYNKIHDTDMEPYTALARFYDLENASLTEDLPLWEEMTRAHNGGPVLELGCGTGRVLLHLARAGFRGIGVDSSPEMLQRAHARMALNLHLSDRFTLMQADFTRLQLNAEFPLILAPFNTLAHLTNPAALRQTLDVVARHLAPGGEFAFDLPSPATLFASEQDGLVLERVFQDEECGSTIQQFSILRVERLAQLGMVTWIYDETAADGTLRRTSVPITMRYFFPAELELLMERAGLRLTHLWGDFDRSAWDDDSPKLVGVAAKE
jgi:SAM-dependent methyltransferase